MEERIYEMCIGKQNNDAIERLEKAFGRVRYCDSGIDDGLDDEDYLMYESYDVYKYHVKLYYPQSNGIVTDVRVTKL